MTVTRIAPLAALALGLAVAAPVNAATVLGTFVHDYGSAPGKVDPGGNDVLNTNSVTVSDASSERFFDGFDFSGVAASAITSLRLTLTFADLGGFNLFTGAGELWTPRILGSDNSDFNDDFFDILSSSSSPQSFTISAATDTIDVDAFEHSVASKRLDFWFSEWAAGTNTFTLSSAKLEVIGEPVPAPVPLPAGGLMLLGGLGVMAVLRRRAPKA